MRFLKLERNKNVILLWFEDREGKIRSLEFRSKKQIKNFLALLNEENIEVIKRELEKAINSS